MKARWEQLQALLNTRALRERILVFIAVVAVLGMGAYQGVIAPLLAERATLERETRTVRNEIQGLRAEMERLSDGRFAQERKRLERKQRGLQDRLAEEQRVLEEKVGQFIRPDRLMGFFEDLLLARNAGEVRVKEIGGQKREALSLQGEGVADIRLYRKGVKVVVETDYASTLDFLERIEALPWAVQVTQLDYEVVGYPLAEVALTAHTFLLASGGGAGDG